MRRFLVTLAFSISIANSAFADRVVGNLAGSSKIQFTYPSEFKLYYDTERPRGVFWSPFFSFWIPGLDQFIEGQTAWGAGYFGVAVAGYATAYHIANKVLVDEREDRNEVGGLDSRNNDVRAAMLGTLAAQGAGGMSAYHAFRTAAISHQRTSGRFAFLQEHDSIGEIFAAPFHFEFLGRPTTYLPLLVGAGLNYLIYQHATEELGREAKDLSGADIFYLSAFSYNAGTHEEAMFRGWLMPMFHDMGFNTFFANFLQATIFAAMHISEDNQFPLIQFAGGLVDGFVTINNGWSIQESVFGHVWWDVLAFSTAYIVAEEVIASDREKMKKYFGEKPVEIWLPAFNMVF